MENISFGIAFLAGVLSFLSPCVLPLVPGYISFLSGVSLEELKKEEKYGKVLRKAGMASVSFVMGFSVIFVALGASATFIGKLLSEYMYILTKIAGAVIVILGLHLAGVLKMNWLNYRRQLTVKRSSPGLLTAFVVGMAFGFGWTPCIGPILAGILAIAAAQETVFEGMLLLAVYSLGLGIPFILTGFATGAFMKFFEKYRKFIKAGEIVAGALLIGVGLLIFFGNLGILTKFMPAAFYEFSK
jgi:cytochrome c-type biogenesis protein